MKKLIACAVLAGALSGCWSDFFSSNRRIWRDGNHTFTRAIVRMGDTWEKVDITSWADFPDGDEVQIWTRDGRCILTHYANCVLINDNPRH